MTTHPTEPQGETPVRRYAVTKGFENDNGDFVKLVDYRTLELALQRRDGEFDMLKHLARQREWSERTFGPGPRTAGVIDHIRKELKEIEDAPGDVSEWIDVTILALDGAWRAGFTPEQIVAAIQAKQAKNEARKWPDWRTSPADKAIEHDRSEAARKEGADRDI